MSDLLTFEELLTPQEYAEWLRAGEEFLRELAAEAADLQPVRDAAPPRPRRSRSRA